MSLTFLKDKRLLVIPSRDSVTRESSNQAFVSPGRKNIQEVLKSPGTSLIDPRDSKKNQNKLPCEFSELREQGASTALKSHSVEGLSSPEVLRREMGPGGEGPPQSPGGATIEAGHLCGFRCREEAAVGRDKAPSLPVVLLLPPHNALAGAQQ
ncbi:unnamed protein product [Boreogadus saida]